jgi:predicted  nucleic acid-binding Zn-ribbon protein
VIRSLPEQLRYISRSINDDTIALKLDTLSKDAVDLNTRLTKAFAGNGDEVLKQWTMLSQMSCPSQIEIEKLSNTLSAFETDLRCCTHEIFAMKQSINSFIGFNKKEMKRMEGEIESAKIEVNGLNKMIDDAEKDIRKYEEEAANEERDAVELERRARYLKRKSRQYEDNGFLWGIGSTVVGLLFAPVTCMY